MISARVVARYWSMMECRKATDFEHEPDGDGKCVNCAVDLTLWVAAAACNCSTRDIEQAQRTRPYNCRHGVHWYFQDNGPTYATSVDARVAHPFIDQFITEARS